MYPKYLIFAMICIKLYLDSCRQVWNVKTLFFGGGLSDKSDRSDGSGKSENRFSILL